ARGPACGRALVHVLSRAPEHTGPDGGSVHGPVGAPNARGVLGTRRRRRSGATPLGAPRGRWVLRAKRSPGARRVSSRGRVRGRRAAVPKLGRPPWSGVLREAHAPRGGRALRSERLCGLEPGARFTRGNLGSKWLRDGRGAARLRASRGRRLAPPPCSVARRVSGGRRGADRL